MHTMPEDVADKTILETKDRLGRPVDPGVSTSVKNLLRAGYALGITTTQSCEGHIDWGHPYPWVDMELIKPYPTLKKIPWWRFWRTRSQSCNSFNLGKEAKNFEHTLEEQAIFLTRILLEYSQKNMSGGKDLLSIHEIGSCAFRISPAHTYYAEGLKKSGDYHQLEKQLQLWRTELEKFSAEVLRQTENIQSAALAPADGDERRCGPGKK